mgnify:CR=1 FL=1
MAMRRNNTSDETAARFFEAQTRKAHLTRMERRVADLEAALKEACDGWEQQCAREPDMRALDELRRLRTVLAGGKP